MKGIIVKLDKQLGRRIIAITVLLGLVASLLVAAQTGKDDAPPIILNLPIVATQPPSSSRPASAPPLYLGLDAYRHWDKLSYLEVGDRIAGMTTADPAGSNSDNRHPVRRLADGETVLFEQAGPGVVSFMRMQENYGNPWNLYLDGSRVAQMSAAQMGIITPTVFPARAFPYPLSLNVTETRGSSIIAAAIPFQQSMMWTSAGSNGNFYAIYRKLPYGTPLDTWSGSEPISDVVGSLRQAGSDIAPSNTFSQSGSLTLDNHETTVMNLSGGPRQIRALKFRVPENEIAAFGNARLRIYWDGETNPSVDAPLKFIVGDGAGVYQPAGRELVQGWPANAGVDAGSEMAFNLYWPMPFLRTAHITLTGVTSATIANVGWNALYEPFPDPPGWWGRFHATYTSIPNPIAGQDMTFLDVSGSGKVVGTVVNFTAPDGTLEGDPHFYIDDSSTPQIQVTGTEEWGLGGNYWNGGQQTSLPLGGLPSSVNNPPGSDSDGAALYRFLIADAIPFNRHLTLRWEHGPHDDVNDHPYRAAVLWYGTPTQTALLSDDLPLGSASSRTAHNYRSPTESDYSLTAAYEYPVHNPLISASGVRMTGISSFTMNLDPSNVGAFLRRTFDSGVANQQANIYIDGQFAGVWYSAGGSDRTDSDGHPRRWRDEDFPLPPALTRGKVKVTVRVEFVPSSDPPDSAWTEFRYQLYSLVMPPNSAPPAAANDPPPAPTWPFARRHPIPFAWP